MSRDPYRSLVVIDRLEIGPVRVEPRRLMATYRVSAGGESHELDLVYRYPEDVFDDGPASRNLASMVAAQVALNYGLFCREIVFHGPYDRHDRAFIERFTEHTAREIYVHKFLMPNPFLVGAAAELPAATRETYSHAALRFPDAERRGAGQDGHAGSPWSGDPNAYAVLSSGGKDSLLSTGLLEEIGGRVHPLFVNESGRHWYTALNAFRELSVSRSAAARIWTNADRVFAWMLRRLPFVRADFARVRHDEYPIRLWTVAVFLFGTLPLVRSRGLGRVVIGNEFDTTVRGRHRGVPHHGALFDQGRLFDDALCRYYRAKGWRVSQFSILRPLSELLIEKILVERYPELQALQTSCHATHIEDGRVRPCGRCEKCRRIVGMLVGLGHDPQRCGYSAEQIEHCLAELIEHGVHQEQAGARHLFHLLHEQGRINDAAAQRAGAAAQREVAALRFHPLRSPFDSIPRDLRRPLWSRYLEHADGALVRDGRAWVDGDPLAPAALEPPFEHEPDAGPGGTTDGHRSPAASFLLAEMTWPEAQRRFAEVDVALLPVGAIEQHGPHLPLDTDSFDADYLARRVATACSDPRPIVLPPVAYGVSYHHDEFAGTFSVSPETQAKLIYEIGMAAVHNGVKKLVIVNGHGGNAPALNLAAQAINRDGHVFTCVDTGETSDHDVHEYIGGHNDVHAGEIETSTTLANRPELVRMELAPNATPRFSSEYLDFTSARGVSWYAFTHKISETGVMGDATRATREKGERLWAIMTERLVELVEDLKRMTLEEIYQRRY